MNYEQFDPKTLQLDDTQLEKAFVRFYDFLTQSDYFSIYFESEDQVQQLIVKQQQSFKDSLSLEAEQFTQHYYQLGLMHARMGITYEDLMASLEVLRDALIEEGGAEPLSVFRLIDAIDQHLAHGYFEQHLERAKEEINTNRETLKVLMLEHSIVKLIDSPAQWFSDLLEAWQQSKSATEIADILKRGSALFSVFESLPVSERSKVHLRSLNREQMILARRTAYYVSQHHYIMANFLLLQLQAATMSLSNKLLCVESGLHLHNLRHDPLTGLLTRHDLSLAAARVKRYAWEVGKGMAVLFLDVDYFKQINDSYGHLVGDLVLKKVGEVLRAQLRDQDVAIRYGGEEFLLFLGGVDQQEACAIGDRIRQAIEKLTIQINQQKSLEIKVDEPQLLKVTISVGALFVPNTEKALQMPVEAMIKQADSLLYQAKQTGRNKVECAVLQIVDE